jgi:chitodextrinase
MEFQGVDQRGTGRVPSLFKYLTYFNRITRCTLCVLSLVGLALTTTSARAADTTKPTAPTALTAAGISGTQLNLSWTASTDNVGVTGYHIERCTGSGCTTFAEIGTSAANTYVDAGLTNTTTYRYRVRANDAAGNLSTYSGAITAKTLDTQPPTAPTLSATVNSAVKITVNWTAATDNVAVKGYYVDRCTGTGCSEFAQLASTTTALTYGNTGLTPLTSYQYRVRAYDAAGNQTASNTISATTSADTTKPTAPSGVSATAINANQVALSWTVSTDNVGVTGYLVERCTGAACTNYSQIGTSATPAYSDNTAVATTTYRYRIRARDAANNVSGYSTVVSVTTPALTDTTPPTVPGNLVATATSSTQINLTWTASTDDVGVTAYLIERCQGSGCSSFSQIASTTTSNTNYTDTSLTPATNYSYRVRAADAANNLSDYSPIANAATQYAGPITYTYSYDTLGRISHVAGSDGSSVDYQYDANGNVTMINRQ